MLDVLAAAVLLATAPLAAVALRRDDVDAELVVVTLVTVAVAALGGALVVLVPQVFSMRRFTVGGAFVAGMHFLVVLALPSTFARFREEIPDAARTSVAATLLSYVLVIGVLLAAEARRSQRRSRPPRVRPRYIGAVFVFSVLVVAVFALVVRPLPIVASLQGVSGAELDRLRDRSFASLEPRLLAYLLGFVRTLLLPFVAGVLAVRAAETGSRLRWLPAIAVSGLAVFAAMATVEKALVPRVVLILVIAGMLADSRHRRRLSTVSLGAVLAVGFPFLIAKQSNSSSTSSLALVEAIIRRVVILPSEVVFQYFHWTTDNGHLLGATLPYVSKVLPSGPVDIAGEVYDASFSAGAGVAGHANGAYVGFLWVDFGWTGIVVGSIVVGATLVAFEAALRLIDRAAVGKALRAVVFVQTLQLPSTSLFSALLVVPFGLVDLTILVVGWQLLGAVRPRAAARPPGRISRGVVPA